MNNNSFENIFENINTLLYKSIREPISNDYLTAYICGLFDKLFAEDCELKQSMINYAISANELCKHEITFKQAILKHALTHKKKAV